MTPEENLDRVLTELEAEYFRLLLAMKLTKAARKRGILPSRPSPAPNLEKVKIYRPA